MEKAGLNSMSLNLALEDGDKQIPEGLLAAGSSRW